MMHRLSRAVAVGLLAVSATAALPLAADSAGNYPSSSSWVSGGHRGDVNSGLWELETGTNGGFAGHFMGDSTLGGGDVNSANGRAFAMYANPPLSPAPYAASRKPFAKPALTTGDTLTFRLAVNYRNGSKGFNLRDTSDASVFTFNVGRVDGVNSGYYIRSGPSSSVNYDNGQQFGGYDANTVFTFTFVQHERTLSWTAVRSGGVEATVSGTAPIASGTVGSVRFFISGTDGGGLPENNLYFNDIVMTPGNRGDLPLTLGERRMPGSVPSPWLRFSDPVAFSVTVRTSFDGFAVSHPMTKIDDVWMLDIRTLGLTPGWHEFKFRPDSNWESGSNRFLYIREDGLLSQPPAVYLTWETDPTTTQIVHWHADDPSQRTVRYRPRGSEEEWTEVTGTAEPFPHIGRDVVTARLTGLTPGGEYEFMVEGNDDVNWFRTLPATLDEPLRLAFGGDVLYGADAERMTGVVAAQDPALVVIGGDHAYENSRAAEAWKWQRYLENWYTRLRAPDGRMIPTVNAIGNHEMWHGFIDSFVDYEDSPEWRRRYGVFYFHAFAFPGPASSYAVLDAGDYLSLILLDTDHARSMEGAQTAWLAETLSARHHMKHIFPVYHVPGFPSNRGYNDPRPVKVRSLWVPLFEQTGINLVFEHHDHAYKRTRPMLNGEPAAGGITYVGDGAWGVATRAPKDPASTAYLEVSAQRHHAFIVTLTPSGRTVQAFGSDGSVFDSLTQGRDGLPAGITGLFVDRLRPRSVRLSWEPAEAASSYVIERDGVVVATTTGTSWIDEDRQPETVATYRVTARNRAGDSAPSAPVEASTPRETVQPFPLDGSAATPGYLLASPGLVFHAALRGTELYVAMPTPAGGDRDHFVLVAPEVLPEATSPAPWAKVGFTAHPMTAPYLGGESASNYAAWSRAPATAKARRGASAGDLLEGLLDLEDAFGGVPEWLHLAAVAYATADGGALLAQSSAGNGDGDVQPAEFLSLPTAALRDSLGTGVFDRLDPGRQFRAELSPPAPGEGFTIRWRAVPGRQYQVWRSTDLAGGTWDPVLPEPIVAPSGVDTLSVTDADSAGLGRVFYRVQAVSP